MFLSIIIPVYNCEAYIEDCLQSCLDQDIPEDEYEILCVNDGSTDSSGEILQKYSNTYARIKLFTQKNKGVSVARNVGLDNAVGEYIMFVDGDDLIRSRILGKLKELMTATDCDQLEIGGYIGESKAIEDCVRQIPKPNCFYPDLLWLSIFRRRVIEQYKLRFIEGITHSEDILFVNDFINVCSESVKFSETVYFYRRHGGSAIDRKSLKTRINLINSYYRIVVICRDRMFDAGYNKTLVYNFWRKHMFYLMRYLPELPYQLRCEWLRKIKKSKPYLRVTKQNKNQIKPSLRRKMRWASMFRHAEIIVYANRIGARLLVARRKCTDSAIAHIIKHPKRFIKNPVRFLKSNH